MDQAKARLYSVTRTIVEMCIDRGYLVVEEDLNETLEQFIERFSSLRR